MNQTKTIQQALEENPQAYQWKDGTIDWVLPPEGTFAEAALSCKCILCNTQIMLGMERILARLGQNTKGMQNKCPGCQQNYFLHQHIPLTTNMVDMDVNSVFGNIKNF